MLVHQKIILGKQYLYINRSLYFLFYSNRSKKKMTKRQKKNMDLKSIKKYKSETNDNV